MRGIFDAKVMTPDGVRDLHADVDEDTGDIITKGAAPDKLWHVDGVDYPPPWRFEAARVVTSKGRPRSSFPPRWMRRGDRVEVLIAGKWVHVGIIEARLPVAHTL